MRERRKRIVVVGGGFAGVWAAIAAARVRRHAGRSNANLEILLIARDPWLTVRPRLYETELNGVRISLDEVLGPVEVSRLQADVTGIDVATRTVVLDGEQQLEYDRLVLASGSRLQRPDLPGIERAFAVDTYADALSWQQHLNAVDPAAPAVVVGAGFTGIEVSTELASRMPVVLVEREPVVARDLADVARPHVEQALAQLGIRVYLNASVRAIDPKAVLLSSGESIETRTVVWTGGFRASPLAAQLGVQLDELGRVPVDAALRVRGVNAVYAAGDVACAHADARHISPMSCQHAVPMGERAGANAALELLGLPVLEYAQPDHVVCLDLGAAGGLFIEGWREHAEVKLTGLWGKRMKETINKRLIYVFG
jgi:NADH:quinone reductase (non-electrogenic)